MSKSAQLFSESPLSPSLSKISRIIETMPHSPEKKALSLEVSKLQSHYEESFESPSLKPEATKKNSLDQNKSELAAVEIEREAHNAPPSLKDVIKSLLMWQKTTHEHLKQENLN